MIAIELNSTCNHSCAMCPYRKDNKEVEKGIMEWDTFKKLVDETTVDEIALFNRGEPMLYPKIYEAIEYAQRKANVIISTNGVLLDLDKLFKVFKRGTLCISCPAGKRETFENITGYDNFPVVKQNIIAIQTHHNAPGIDFYVKMVSQPQNQNEDALLREFCKKVVVVDDSNQENPNGYEDCTQPDTCWTYNFRGEKKVCCRADNKYDWETYYNQAKKRELPICKLCGIR